MSMNESPATIDRIDASTPGRWLVTTQGSQHIWDIDNMTYQRLAGDGRGNFEFDGVVVAITKVGRWPAVGTTSVVWFDDVDLPDTLEQSRVSSTIRSIVQVADASAPA